MAETPVKTSTASPRTTKGGNARLSERGDGRAHWSGGDLPDIRMATNIIAGMVFRTAKCVNLIFFHLSEQCEMTFQVLAGTPKIQLSKQYPTRSPSNSTGDTKAKENRHGGNEVREGNTFSFSTIGQQFFLKDPDGIERNEKIRNSPKATSPRNKTQVATLSTHHMKNAERERILRLSHRYLHTKCTSSSCDSLSSNLNW